MLILANVTRTACSHSVVDRLSAIQTHWGSKGCNNPALHWEMKSAALICQTCIHAPNLAHATFAIKTVGGRFWGETVLQTAYREGGKGGVVWADAVTLHGMVEIQGGHSLLGPLTGRDEGIVDMQGEGDACPLHASLDTHCLLPITLQAASGNEPTHVYTSESQPVVSNGLQTLGQPTYRVIRQQDHLAPSDLCCTIKIAHEELEKMTCVVLRIEERICLC